MAEAEQVPRSAEAPPSWRVLYVRARCEKKLAEYCDVHGLSCYLPLRRETKIYQRRKVTVEKPLFPGYVFASFDREGRLQLLKSNSVVRILDPADEDELLRQLDQVRAVLAVDPTLRACDALARGRHVRITGGAFEGVEGVVSAVKGDVKVRLNVDLIGQAVAVEVDREYLQVIE